MHSYFIVFTLIRLGEQYVALNTLLPSPSWDQTWVRSTNGLQHIQYCAAKLAAYKIKFKAEIHRFKEIRFAKKRMYPLKSTLTGSSPHDLAFIQTHLVSLSIDKEIFGIFLKYLN